MARKIFGNESPIGKQVKIKSGTGFLRSDKWTVGAVYEDLPANSQIRNEIYMKIPDFFLQNFGASNFVCYLRLDDSENVSLVENEFNSKFEFKKYRTYIFRKRSRMDVCSEVEASRNTMY